MISAINEARILRSEHLAPKRLRRCDVETIRRLHQDAYAASRTGVGITRRIYLPRSDADRALARLGARKVPYCRLRAYWMKADVWGLQVDVYACSSSDDAICIGDHRFRETTTVQRFTRDVSRYVRLGFGHLNSLDG